MASQPDPDNIPGPDTIEPTSPQESPDGPMPDEAPMQEPPGFDPPQPDTVDPDRGPDEI